MGRIIGIDLGTTNSLVAVWENGHSQLIPNSFGEYLTPSVVSVDKDGTVYVGKIAKERLISHPEETVCEFKRFMGTSKVYGLQGRGYRPEDLSALVLRKLKEDAQNYLGEPVEEAMISVPAYFNDMARRATKDAGELAGLKVERIINEPSAAALACQQHWKSEDSTLLIFDFGGGTLDVSLVECFDNIIEIIAVSGNNHLGGSDFDWVIAEEFCKKYDWVLEELPGKRQEIILKSANQLKCDLTEHIQAVMHVTDGDFVGEMEFSRKDVIHASKELFQKMAVPIRKVLADGETGMDDISQVVLVGGSCKMPVVQQYISHVLKTDRMLVMEPDHMIAFGVGVYAGIKERNEDIRDVLLTDICPFSLGTGVYNALNTNKSLMSVIIDRNSTLPTSKESTFCTVYNRQNAMEIKVYQGEEMYVENNILLGTLNIPVPPAPKGQEIVCVRYTYDINGILIVDAQVLSTGLKKQLVLTNKQYNIPSEEMEKHLKKLEKLKIHPRDKEENRLLIARGERLYQQAWGVLREEILARIQYFQHLLSEQEEYKIMRWRKHLEAFLNEMEEYLNTIQAVTGEEDPLSWYEEEQDEDEWGLKEEYTIWRDGNLTS